MKKCVECGTAYEGDRNRQLCDGCREAHRKEIDRRKLANLKSVPMTEKRQPEPKKSLSEMNREALDHGMTYGKYAEFLANKESMKK